MTLGFRDNNLITEETSKRKESKREKLDKFQLILLVINYLLFSLLKNIKILNRRKKRNLKFLNKCALIIKLGNISLMMRNSRFYQNILCRTEITINLIG